MNINLVAGPFHHMEDDGSLCMLADDIGIRVVVSDRDRPIITQDGEYAERRHVLFCRTVMHESSVAHYGFLERDDRRAFDRIVKLKGCGPGMAMKLLSVHDAKTLGLIIGASDTTALRTIPGLGPKMVERLLVELRL